jgi:hypothetical protein
MRSQRAAAAPPRPSGPPPRRFEDSAAGAGARVLPPTFLRVSGHPPRTISLLWE